MSLETTLLGKKLKNPTILASGVLGTTAASLVRISKQAGAVTTKSIGPEYREGHKNPTVVELDNGLINAVGLSSGGIEEGKQKILDYKNKTKVPIIASIYASNPYEFAHVAEEISATKPDFIELNMSCPNVNSVPFAAKKDTASDVVSRVKEKTGIPLIAKLTPSVPDIASIAKSCEDSGASAITAVNTMPGMVIDIKVGRPVLANKSGGVSGSLIKPVAIRCVYQIYEAVDIPIIGVGGVSTGKDAVEMIMAGASAVGIGSGVLKTVDVFSEVSSGISEFMKENGYKKLEDIRGVAHH